MYRGSKKYAAGVEAALYLAVAELAISAQAKKVGVSPSVVRTLVQVSAMRAGGAEVMAVDLEGAGFGTGGPTNLVECRRLGWVHSVRGKLDVLSPGREVVASLALAWERAKRQLAGFGDARPYSGRPARRVEKGLGERRAKKASATQKDGY